MTHAARAAFLISGLLVVGGSIHQAMADFIPLNDGAYAFLESVDYGAHDQPANTRSGNDDQAPERVSASAGGAVGWAETTAGGGGQGATAAARGEAQLDDDGFPLGIAAGQATVFFDAQLIKLHPDAPDDVFVPIFLTTSLTGGARVRIRNLQTGEQLFDVISDFGAPASDVQSSITTVPGTALQVVSNAGSRPASPAEPASTVVAPVFAIDPNFLVPFIDNADGSQRFERAVDLYTLGYPAPIGFAGDFKTVTPLTDGCLPDPSILGPDGNQSVTGNATVYCQALDPSGFRSYAPGVQDPLGQLSDMTIQITPGAIVRTDAPDTETLGMLGSNNDIFNQGTILATGARSDAVFFAEGSGNTVTNFGAVDATGMESHAIFMEGDDVGVYSTGAISTSGDFSAAVYLEGDRAGVLNEGVVTTDGFQSSAVVLEGDDATVQSEGDVQTSAGHSAGLVIEGDNGSLFNSGTIGTQGAFSAGLVMLGFYSDGVGNTGRIATIADDAMGILALGPGHSIDNIDTEATTGIRNRIWTTGDRAHGIALGLQDPPAELDIPAPALLPVVDGRIENAGLITTEGVDADAIHALAEALPVMNIGILWTTGRDAHGISLVGGNAVIDNGDGVDNGNIWTDGDGANGIDVWGNNAQIRVGGGVALSAILTEGERAHGIFVSGTHAEIGNDGVIEVQGSNAVGIDVFGDDASVVNAGFIDGGFSWQPSGVRGIGLTSDRSATKNLGRIEIRSASGYGVTVVGDDVTVANGDTSHQGAEIIVTGSGVAGIGVASNAPAISNDGSIKASGEDAVGIAVTAGSGAVFQFTSAGSIDVDGLGAVGMLLSTSSVWGAGAALPTNAGCVQVNDGTSKLVNCGSIDFAGIGATAGIQATSVRNTTVENQGRIDGSGIGAVGIHVTADATYSGTRNNLISNIDAITVDGDSAAGLALSGNGNVVLQGNGTIGIPNSPFEYVTDLQSADGFSLFPNAEQLSSEFSRDLPAGAVIPVARISATGNNSTGLSVTGDNNRIGQLFSPQADQTTIVARGPGAVGVKLSGIDNLFVNGGEVLADGVGIQGGPGAESVTNQWFVEGGIDLAGGNDRMVVDTASVVDGTVDGGDGQDELIFFVGGNLGGGFEKTIDGAQYQNFENVAKIGIGTLWVDSTLQAPILAIHKGAVKSLVGGSLISEGNSIHVYGDGALGGAGTVVGRVVLEGGSLAPGIGLGDMTIDGDLFLESGVLEFEMSQIMADSLTVTGDVFLNAGRIDVVVDYIPDPQDVLPLLLFGNSLQLAAGFDGIIGRAANTTVPIGTQFMVSLGEDIFDVTVTSMIPLPPAVYLFVGGLLALAAVGRRKRN